jgi:hypothetical protein
MLTLKSIEGAYLILVVGINIGEDFKLFFIKLQKENRFQPQNN